MHDIIDTAVTAAGLVPTLKGAGAGGTLLRHGQCIV